MKCVQCGLEYSEQGELEQVASIAGGIMGDEYIETYYFCKVCQVYTVEVYHDRFCGEDTVSFRGPLTEAEGNAKVEIIRRCPDPQSKRCRCGAHQQYFEGWRPLLSAFYIL